MSDNLLKLEVDLSEARKYYTLGLRDGASIIIDVLDATEDEKKQMLECFDESLKENNK